MFEAVYPQLLIGAGLVFVAVLTSLIAFRIGAPLLLVFLALGLVAGEDGLGLRFDDAALAYQAGGVALAVILFDSGFGTKLSAFRAAAAPAIVLATLGVVLTAALVGIAAHVILGFPWLSALMIGAIIGSTDAAAVFFLLRVGRITLRERIRSTLEIESGSNDPMAIFLTVTLLDLWLVGGGHETIDLMLAAFARQMGLGVALGLIGGFVIVHIVNRLELEQGLYPVLVIAASLLVFATAGSLDGSGFLAAYVAGLYAGNRPLKVKAPLRRFQDGLTWLAQIAMFLVLGLLATPSQFAAIAVPAVVLALVLTLVARPLAVWLCLLPFRFRPAETAFVAWVGLRGAVSILLAILPLAAGHPDGQDLFNIAFIIVLVSLLVQGWTVRPMARWLRLIVPQSIGPVQRVEIDLPGTALHELVVYRVVGDSPVARGARVPRWARPSLVIRDGHSIRYQFAGRLQPGDDVYIFTGPQYIRLLDRLFASPAILAEDDKDFFGEFVIEASKTIDELAASYDIATENLDPAMTLDALIRSRLGGLAEIGDRVGLGEIELVVRDLAADGRVANIGLAVQPTPSRPAQMPLFMNARDLLAWLKARWRRWRQRNRTP
ncbi:MAG: potassium/proton antiporter [Rhodospirillales bacterium]